jgi:hypothetical protein
LVSLKLDDCGLRAAALETLCEYPSKIVQYMR